MICTRYVYTCSRTSNVFSASISIGIPVSIIWMLDERFDPSQIKNQDRIEYAQFLVGRYPVV